MDKFQNIFVILPKTREQNLAWRWMLIEGITLLAPGQSSEMTLKNNSSLWEWWTMAEEVESDGGHGEGVGGHTVNRVLTIPWVISQLSMGSSWSAGLSSPSTLSWINNRITPYTREERPHHSIAHSAERERQTRSQMCKRRLSSKEENVRKRQKSHSIKMKMRKANREKKKRLQDKVLNM